jgi:hypothetical protein
MMPEPGVSMSPTVMRRGAGTLRGAGGRAAGEAWPGRAYLSTKGSGAIDRVRVAAEHRFQTLLGAQPG